eukprot:836446-Pelagomonas_calceolata.AAC.7
MQLSIYSPPLHHRHRGRSHIHVNCIFIPPSPITLRERSGGDEDGEKRGGEAPEASMRSAGEGEDGDKQQRGGGGAGQDDPNMSR